MDSKKMMIQVLSIGKKPEHFMDTISSNESRFNNTNQGSPSFNPDCMKEEEPAGNFFKGNPSDHLKLS